jgi:hypothetical protein
MDRIVTGGSIDVSVVIRIVDDTTGQPENGVLFDTVDLDLQYRREGGYNVAIVTVALATPALNDAHEEGGLLLIGDGYYRVDLPDAAVAVGVAGCLIHGTVPGMVVTGAYVSLVAYDPQDDEFLGLSGVELAAALAGHKITMDVETNHLYLYNAAGDTVLVELAYTDFGDGVVGFVPV